MSKNLEDSRKKALNYRNGGKGFGQWVEDNVCLPIYPIGKDVQIWTPVHEFTDDKHPLTGRSYKSFWENQKKVTDKALVMVDGKFTHKLVMLCWMRGEGKSILACLIQLWKFFCWPRQLIVLCANSKDQSKFVHYDIMRDIITNSPNLLSKIGLKNIKEKDIILRDKNGRIASSIRSISSFSGIVSNITGYTFSEIFALKNERFFVEVDGSMRTITNALGVIDSTVSDRTHLLYRNYKNYVQGKIPSLYFSHRESKKASAKDFWNPGMDQQQLDDYRTKFNILDFDRFFRNTWASGSQKLFTDDMMEACKYIGIDREIVLDARIRTTIQKRMELEEKREDALKEQLDTIPIESNIKLINHRLKPMHMHYRLKTPYGSAKIATVDELEHLSNIFDTDWAILAGVDRADPMKAKEIGARTIITTLAKGLPGSRSNPRLMYEEGIVNKYLYIMMSIFHAESSSIEEIKMHLRSIYDEYDGVDTICAERWGMWDIVSWCEDLDIAVELLHPTYDKQREGFSELFTVVATGRFKYSDIALSGTKGDDLFYEEMTNLDHNPYRKFYGSNEKYESSGVQDDSAYATAWAMFGGKIITADKFRPRKSVPFLGAMYKEPTYGRY